MEAPVSERKFLGIIEVDSGTLVVGDPTYLLPSKEQRKPGVDYQAVIDADRADAVPFARRLTLLINVARRDGIGPYVVAADEARLGA